MTNLTFNDFRKANVARCLKWHPGGIQSWSPSDWLTAVTGELGELASLIKMRNRERDRLPGNKFSPTNKQIADEIADVLTYLDLLAESHGVDLGVAAANKFNEVSERVGFPDRIDVRALAAPAESLHSASDEQIAAMGSAEYVAHRMRGACMDLRVCGELLYLDGRGSDALSIECMEQQLSNMAHSLLKVEPELGS